MSQNDLQIAGLMPKKTDALASAAQRIEEQAIQQGIQLVRRFPLRLPAFGSLGAAMPAMPWPAGCRYCPLCGSLIREDGEQE